MIRKTGLTTLLVGLGIVFLFGQNYSEVIYVTSKNEYLTESGLDSIVARMVKKVEPLDMKVFVDRYDDRIENDTLFRTLEVEILSSDLAEERDLRTKLEGAPLPPFSFTDIDGNNVSSADLEGKVVLINFWFTRCVPCIREMPELNRIQAEYADENIIFLGMAPEASDEIFRFLDRHPFTFRQIPKAAEYIEQFGYGYPKNVLVGADGKIVLIEGSVASIQGMSDEDDLESATYVINSEKLVEAIDRALYWADKR